MTKNMQNAHIPHNESYNDATATQPVLIKRRKMRRRNQQRNEHQYYNLVFRISRKEKAPESLQHVVT